MTSKRDTILELKNVKLVIGNGFDLHCGLKTKYRDYFLSDKNKNEYFKKWINDYKSKAMNYVNFSLSNHKDFWLDFDNFDKTNLWTFFFYLTSNIEPNEQLDWKWCEIEKTILQWVYNKDSRNENISFYSVYLLLSGNYKSSYSENIYILASVAYRKNGEKQIYSTKEFYNLLLKELKLFEKEFGDYIYYQIFDRLCSKYGNKVYINNFPEKTNEAINQLCTRDNIVSIESFNYSSIEIQELESKFHNINGNVDNPIFGVDSSAFFPPDERYIFTKTNRRMELDMIEHKSYEQVDFDNIIIYGHSLNSSDYSYFFSIFDKIDIIDFKNNSKIVFAYSIYDKTKIEKIKSDYRLAIFSLFQEYSKYKGNKEFPNRLLDALTTQGKVLLYEL